MILFDLSVLSSLSFIAAAISRRSGRSISAGAQRNRVVSRTARTARRIQLFDAGSRRALPFVPRNRLQRVILRTAILTIAAFASRCIHPMKYARAALTDIFLPRLHGLTRRRGFFRDGLTGRLGTFRFGGYR